MKTAAAIGCAIGTVVLWVICLGALLQDAGHDPGAYVIAGFVFLLLPGAVVLAIAAIQRERRGYWNRPACRCRTQEEWRANHQPNGAHAGPTSRGHVARHTPQFREGSDREYERLTAAHAEG